MLRQGYNIGLGEAAFVRRIFEVVFVSPLRCFVAASAAISSIKVSDLIILMYLEVT